MTIWEHLTTKFRAYDKLYHAIGCFAAFMVLVWMMSPLLAVVCVTIGGLLKEWRDRGKTFWDWYDVLANTVGILAAWGWTELWK